ncbi:hypothetical protein DFJ74DRAFT_693045 [Hyaloraphidium curvatum]|nr:hypothetical protein DFJ74DRAFT_693045 [Hyaloraphidium curvatum]
MSAQSAVAVTATAPPPAKSKPDDFSLDCAEADFTLNVAGAQFRVHRVVLATLSPVFAAMVSENWQEGTHGSCDLKQDDPARVRKLLQWAYRLPASGVAHMATADLDALYSLADKYGVQSLLAELANQIDLTVLPPGTAKLDWERYLVAVRHRVAKAVGKMDATVVELPEAQFEPLVDQVAKLDASVAFRLERARRKAEAAKRGAGTGSYNRGF